MDRQNLLGRAEQIRTENQPAQNTNERVGSLFADIVEGTWLNDLGLSVSGSGTGSTGTGTGIFAQTGSFFATTNNLQITGSIDHQGTLTTDVLNVVGTTFLGNNVEVDGNIIPSSNVTYNLGSPTNRWNELYLSGSTIFLGEVEITDDPVDGLIARRPGEPDIQLIGKVGPSGSQGPPGAGINVLGQLENETQLNSISNPTIGDGYVIESSLYIWDGDSWEAIDTIAGPQGAQGPAGPVGPKGDKGDQGTGITLLGELTSPPSAVLATQGTGSAYNVGGILYVYNGTEFVESGPIGPQGATGPKGDPFQVDAQGLLSERINFDSRGPGFVFYATDVGQVYIKLPEDPESGESEWSAGIQFRGPAGPEGPRGRAGFGLELNAIDIDRTPYVSQSLGFTVYNPATEVVSIRTDYTGSDPNEIWVETTLSSGPQGPQGPKGDKGDQGENPVLRQEPGGTNTQRYLQWFNYDIGAYERISPNLITTVQISSVETGTPENPKTELRYSTNRTSQQVIASNIRGPQGIVGPQGAKGDPGEGFVIFDSGSESNRPLTPPADFTYFATDTGNLFYFTNSSGSFVTLDYKGPQGDQGVGLQYDFDGTQLAVKREDEPSFTNYVDLSGDDLKIDEVNLSTATGSFATASVGFTLFGTDTGLLYIKSGSGADDWFPTAFTQGPIGPEGPQGPQGIQGPAPQFRAGVSPPPGTAPLEFKNADQDNNQWQVLYSNLATYPEFQIDSSGEQRILEYRTQGFRSTGFIQLGDIRGPEGPEGEAGPSGSDGKGLQIDATGTDRSIYDGESTGFTFLNESTGEVFIRATGGGWTSLGDIQGPSGSQGPQGPAGTNGVNGLDGEDGLSIEYDLSIEGRIGIRKEGEDEFSYVNTKGDPVNFVFRGQWSPSAIYTKGDYVVDQSTYDANFDSLFFLDVPDTIIQYQSSTAPRNDLGNWLEFRAERGPQGIQGPAGPEGQVVFESTWEPDVTYQNGDTVIAPASFNPLNANSFWIALEEVNTSVAPWQLTGEDAEKWEEIVLTPGQGQIPVGGTTNQVLGKTSGVDFEFDWISVPQFSDLDDKVDKVVGKSLTDENFTSALKAKLEGLESSRFKGTYVDTGSLISANPDPISGSYANVDLGPGNDTVRFIWDSDDQQWIEQAGASTQLTATQIKSEYESLPDTNAFTDAASGSVANLPADTQADIDDLTTQVENKLNVELFQETSVPVQFLTEAVYGTEASPIVGDITVNLLDAKLGVSIVIIHNDSTEPTFPSSFKQMRGTPNYSTNEVNFIYVQYFTDNTQIYSITQVN